MAPKKKGGKEKLPHLGKTPEENFQSQITFLRDEWSKYEEIVYGNGKNAVGRDFEEINKKISQHLDNLETIVSQLFPKDNALEKINAIQNELAKCKEEKKQCHDELLRIKKTNFNYISGLFDGDTTNMIDIHYDGCDKVLKVLLVDDEIPTKTITEIKSILNSTFCDSLKIHDPEKLQQILRLYIDIIAKHSNFAFISGDDPVGDLTNLTNKLYESLNK